MSLPPRPPRRDGVSSLVAAIYDVHGNLPALEAVVRDVHNAAVDLVHRAAGPEVQLQRSAYDLGAAAQRVRASGYPLAEEFAAQNILSPPPAGVMRTQYSKVELR